MIGAQEVRDVIDKAEGDFQKCWKTLEVMKCGPIPTGFGEQLLTFQPILAGALFRLDSFYRRLGKEKKATIAEKSRIETEQFVVRMREFDDFRTSIKTVLDIGRSLGDAFAWFFYRKNQDKIAQHLQHPPIPHIPQGVGGQAEVKFLDYMRHAGCIGLYHGITSFLRIGDFSFLDLRSGEVIALGEVKAQKTGPREAIATLHMRGPDAKRVPFSGMPITHDQSQPESSEAQRKFTDRLERQVAEMQKAIKLHKDDNPQGVPTDFLNSQNVFDGYDFRSLQNLGTSLNTAEIAYERVGDGLLLCGVDTLSGCSLSERLFLIQEVDFNARFDDVAEQAVKLVHFKSDHNNIKRGEITTKFLVGCVPLFWTPIDPDFLKKLYFQGAMVVTIYNSAYLLERFIEAGFKVVRSEDGPSYQVEKLLPSDRRCVLENLNWFLMAIQHHLMKEESVVECVVSIMEKMQQGTLPENTRVQLAMRTHIQ